MKPVYKTILLLTVFSIAMGFMESAIVVYLRELYYPSGFGFPLAPLNDRILVTELIRELATIIMLLTAGIIAGRDFAQRFVFFLYSFAIWDIFYYVFLYLLIGWPSGLLEWDILFLIPVPWIGPVLAPCLLSLTMILWMILIVSLEAKKYPVRFVYTDWILMVIACLIIVISFTYGYFSIILDSETPLSPGSMTNKLSSYIPKSYNWVAFICGELILLLNLLQFRARNRRVVPDN